MAMKQLPDDFKDFIRCLNSNEVCYLLVGGWAVGVHANPRATNDIDFLVAMDEKNLLKLQKALLDFDGPPVDMEHFSQKGNVIRIGSSPVRIDIINEADGIDINECYLRKNTVYSQDVEVNVI
jgi:hypothetical protein